jgi:ABC-2 type transport system permease protein
MRNLLTIWRRELQAYATSPAAYVIAVLVLMVTGTGFGLQTIVSRGEPLRLDVLMFWLPTLWMMVLIVATVLTMHLFAEEKRSGTIEALMTAPVTEMEVVIGKYAAAVTLFAIIFAPTAGHIFVLRELSIGIRTIDIVSMIAGYVALLFIGAFYISIGLLISALSKSQIVAAIGTFAVLSLCFLLVGYLSHMSGGAPSALLSCISPFEHISELSRGHLDTRAIVFYLSSIVLMIFTATKVLESRRWL